MCGVEQVWEEEFPTWREADHNEGGKDGCCSGWTFLALTQWSELVRVPTGPEIMVQAAGLLVGLVWGGGIPEFQPGWSGMATPPHLAPRQCTGPNQQDAPWQAYLINGVVVGRVGRIVKERVWEKEWKKTVEFFYKAKVMYAVQLSWLLLWMTMDAIYIIIYTLSLYCPINGMSEYLV